MSIIIIKDITIFFTIISTAAPIITRVTSIIIIIIITTACDAHNNHEHGKYATSTEYTDKNTGNDRQEVRTNPS